VSLATLRAESKKIVRNPIAKVDVIWTDPLIDLSIVAEGSEENRINYPIQAADLVLDVPFKWMHTNHDTAILDGTYNLMPSSLLTARKTQVGWWGTQVAEVDGTFLSSNPTLTLTFAPRLVVGFTVAGDSAFSEYPVDFKVYAQKKVGESYFTVEAKTITGNTSMKYVALFNNEHNSISRIILEVDKWSTPGSVVKIAEFYSSISETFESDQIFYLNFLEEFESSDATLPIGNISCNEIDLRLQNLTDRFYPGNTSSNIYTFIKRNRKIKPYIGFEYSDGTKEYIQKGLYWSGDWTVSDRDTGAQTTARDRMELFRKTDFIATDVIPEPIYNITTKELMVLVLDSLTDYMTDFFYDVSDMDDGYIIPVVISDFFKDKNYFDVIKTITAASLAYSYFDNPTEEEKDLNGVLCNDMLRVKKLETVFPTSGGEVDGIEIQKRDFIEKTQPANTEELANVVHVVYKTWTQDPEDSTKWENEDTTVTSEDSNSISEFGRLSYTYDSNDLIQTEDHAESISLLLLESYSVNRKDIDLLTFGDITLKLANKIQVPDYVKNGVETYGSFTISKLNTQYDGALRVNVKGRKITDTVVPVVYTMVQDTEGALTKWQDTDSEGSILYQDAGV
jgi:hypothetical protein